MGNLATNILQNQLLRIWIYGPSKTRKTWWIARLAELGYNVNFVMGDQNGAQILHKITNPEARKRINVWECQDRDEPLYQPMVRKFLNNDTNTFWDEILHTNILNPAKIIDTHPYMLINKRRLNSNDVVVFDSYTALVRSTCWRYDLDQQNDPADALKQDWDGYGSTGRFCTWFARTALSLPCHVIIIGHEDIYEKRKITTNAQGKQTLGPIEWARTQLKSTSGPHAKTLTTDGDVIWFKTADTIVTSGAPNREGGCRLFEPGEYKWDDVGPDKIFLNGMIRPPDKDAKPSTAFISFATGKELKERLSG